MRYVHQTLRTQHLRPKIWNMKHKESICVGRYDAPYIADSNTQHPVNGISKESLFKVQQTVFLTKWYVPLQRKTCGICTTGWYYGGNSVRFKNMGNRLNAYTTVITIKSRQVLYSQVQMTHRQSWSHMKGFIITCLKWRNHIFARHLSNRSVFTTLFNRVLIYWTDNATATKFEQE